MRLGSAESDRRGYAHESHRSQAIFRSSKARFQSARRSASSLVQSADRESRLSFPVRLRMLSSRVRLDALNTGASLRTHPGHTLVCTDSFRRATFEFE